LTAASFDYKKAIELKEDFWEAYGGLGFVSQAQGDWKGALTNYDQAIRLRPDHAEFYLGRGAARHTEEDLTGALSDYNKSIDLKPEFAEAYANRGQAKQATGDPTGALADYNTAARLNPALGSQIAPGLRALGFFRYNLREFSQALANFRRACEMDPSDDYAHFGVWLVRSRLGEASLAADELQMYFKNQSGVRPDAWSSKIGTFLIGAITEPELFAAAEDLGQRRQAEQRCEAYFYAATKRLSAGDKSIARNYLENCVATGAKSCQEYLIARSELESMKAAK
jgi:lipoprotein NlpI